MPPPDFPKTHSEFQNQFPTEEAQLGFLFRSRWPDGFVCPRCGSRAYYWKSERKLLQCKDCGYQASVTAGTIMHRSKVPLSLWFQAAYVLTTHSRGLSALQFQKQIGLSSYQTAFSMLHKLRGSMAMPGKTKLSGIIEVDETCIGRQRHGKRRGKANGASTGTLVIGAVDLNGKYTNRIRLKAIPNAGKAELLAFLKDNVEPGSTIQTNESMGYAGFEIDGFKHITTARLSHIRRVFNNLNTWLLGTHHRVSEKHLQAYLNEFAFRFNRRKAPMAVFQTLLGLGKILWQPQSDPHDINFGR